MKIASTFVAILLALSVAACSGDESDGPDDMAVPVGSSLSVDNFGSVVGLAMAEAGSGHLILDVTSGGVPVAVETGFQSDAEPDAPASTTTMRLGTAAVDMTFVEGVIYTRTENSEFGEKWLSIPADDPRLTTSYGSYGDLRTLVDPVRLIVDLGGAATSVEAVETAEVDGVETTRYDVVFKSAEVSALRFLNAELDEQLEVQIFVDESDLPRKILMPTVGEKPLTIMFENWGGPVDVSAPAEDETVTLDATPQEAEKP